MFAKNKVITIIIIGIVTIIFSTNVMADLKEPPTFSKEWPKASEKVYQLYQALHNGAEIPELMLKKVDDTLTYGQFWPDDKFEIIKRGDMVYIPLAIWTGEDTCADLRQYIEHDPKIRMFSGTHSKYMVPLTELAELGKLDCIKNLEGPHPIYPAINIITTQWSGSQYLKHGLLSEVKQNGTINLYLKSKGMFKTGGYKVTGTINVDSSVNSIKIRTKIVSPRGVVTQTLAFAGGSLSFTPPSDSFNLDLDGDIYSIILKKNSIYIRPHDVCNNVITHQSAPRSLAK